MREFRPDDLAAVGALIHRAIEASYAGAYPPRAIAHFHEHHTEGNIVADAEQGYMVVVERGGQIVVTGTLVGNDIRRVYVEPACQGQGCGTAIMRTLEDRARQTGATAVVVYSSTVAKPFYERLGYVVVEEGAADLGEGQVLRFYRMTKSLAAAGDS